MFFCCCSTDVESLERRQQREREIGQRLLKEMVFNGSTPSTTPTEGGTRQAPSGDGPLDRSFHSTPGQDEVQGAVGPPDLSRIDWKAVIAKADELHRREQVILRQQRKREAAKARSRSRQRRRQLKERRKQDSMGSFSVNMLTYKPNGQITRLRDQYARKGSSGGSAPNLSSDSPHSQLLRKESSSSLPTSISFSNDKQSARERRRCDDGVESDRSGSDRKLPITTLSFHSNRRGSESGALSLSSPLSSSSSNSTTALSSCDYSGGSSASCSSSNGGAVTSYSNGAGGFPVANASCDCGDDRFELPFQSKLGANEAMETIPEDNSQ